MASIAEILAAKKAAKELADKKPVNTSILPDDLAESAADSRIIPGPAITEEERLILEERLAPVEHPATLTITEPVKAEPATLPSKPLSFAEKMAMKKKQEAEAAAKTVAFSPPVEPRPEPAIKLAAAVASIVKAAPVEQEEDSTEIEQAYADIKYRIDQLVELSEEPLVNAMTELKKSLMKNPNAVSLMLDSDIGQMVIALRKMTHTAATEVAKPSKKGPKAKNITLTAADMEAAFDSL